MFRKLFNRILNIVAKKIKSIHSVSGCVDSARSVSLLTIANILNSIIFKLITASAIITLLRLISNESDGQYEIMLEKIHKINITFKS